MHINSRFLFWFLLGGFVAGSISFAHEAKLSQLDSLTAQWIQLRSTLAEEKRIWKNRRQAWTDEIRLLEEQARILQQEIDDSREVLSNTEEQQAEIIAEKDQLETTMNQMEAKLEKSIREARKVTGMLPPSLEAKLSSELRSLLENEGRDLPRAQRAQRVVALLSTLESIQNQVHVVSETLESEQGRRQVSVLYLGLSVGFAVSPNQDWAAVGVPGQDGWMWSPGGVDPQAVHTLIEVNEKRQTATLVEVPFPKEVTP